MKCVFPELSIKTLTCNEGEFFLREDILKWIFKTAEQNDELRDAFLKQAELLATAKKTK